MLDDTGGFNPTRGGSGCHPLIPPVLTLPEFFWNWNFINGFSLKQKFSTKDFSTRYFLTHTFFFYQILFWPKISFWTKFFGQLFFSLRFFLQKFLFAKTYFLQFFFDLIFLENCWWQISFLTIISLTKPFLFNISFNQVII